MARFLTQRMLALVMLIASALVLLGWTQQWVSCVVNSSEIRQPSIALTGQEATVLPAGLALVGFALALLLLMASRLLGFVIGGLALVLALSGLVLCISFVSDPILFTLPALSRLSGIADDAVLRSFVTSFAFGWGVWVATVAFVLVALAAGIVLVQARHWGVRRSRFERVTTSRLHQSGPVSGQNTIDAWDDITRGGDPTA